MDLVVALNIILFLSLCIIGLIVLFRNRKRFVDIIQFQINSKNMLRFMVMFLLGSIVMFTMFYINIKLELITHEGYRGFDIIFKTLPTELINSIGEEFLLRVFVFIGILSLKNNKLIALFLSSLIFCLLHNPDSWISFLTYYIAGLMYGISFLSFQTIWAPIGLHFAWNYIQGIIFSFQNGGDIHNGYLITKTIESEIWNGGILGIERSVLGISSRLFIIVAIFLIAQNMNKRKLSKEFLNIDKMKGTELLRNQVL